MERVWPFSLTGLLLQGSPYLHSVRRGAQWTTNLELGIKVDAAGDLVIGGELTLLHNTKQH